MSLQLPACDRCSQGVMDATNDHARGLCSCPCHPCRCEVTCCDSDPDGPGVCKGLPRAPAPPLVEIVLVPRYFPEDEVQAESMGIRLK